MKKKPPETFYGVFDHFPRTYEVAKFWTIKLYLNVKKANEHTRELIFCLCHFVLLSKRIILSKSYYFGFTSPLMVEPYGWLIILDIWL